MKQKATLYGLVASLALVLIAGACGHNANAPNDGAITSAIQAKLYQNPDLRKLSVNVASNQGVVTLSGAVNTPVEKLAVEDLARSTPGVTQVIDNLTAQQPASPQAAALPPEQTYPARRAVRRHERRRIARNGSSQRPADSPDSVPPVQEADSAPPAAAPQPAPEPPPEPQPVTVTIPSGTPVIVRMIDSISSATAQPDQFYAASVFSPVVVGNKVVVDQGANARVRVVEVKSAGHYRGASELKLELADLTINGQSYPVKSGDYVKRGASRGKNSAEKIGGGAGLGALLGGLIGHGKGAGIGAVIGAAGGTVAQGVTKGQQVAVPSEAQINFTLQNPLTVTLPPEGSSGSGQ